MGAPPEPLLPAESPRPSPLKLWLLVAGAAAALLGALAIAILLPSRQPLPTEPVPDRPVSTDAVPKAGTSKETSVRAKQTETEEKAAQELYASAEAFERSTPGDPEKAMAQYLRVFQAHPTTSWGKKAGQKHRQLSDALQASLDREFQSVKKEARSRAAAGHTLDAIEAVRNYLKEQKRDSVRQRAELEIASLENGSREAFNKIAQQAGAMVKKGEYKDAEALFEALKAGAIPEVAARCDAAIGQLREAAKASDAAAAAKQSEEAHKAFREGAAPKVLALLRARRYEEGLKQFDAASADPAAAPLQADLARERAAISQAAAFWETFLKALRARLNQDVSIAVVGAKEARVAGKLVRLDAERIVLEAADGMAEVPFDKVHVDQIVAWTIGKTLPTDDAATYVKAALFFFGDGRDDLARLYLATAKELGAEITEPERVFREGFLRAAHKK